MNKRPALDFLIDKCEDIDVKLILESDLFQQGYNSIPKDFQAMSPNEAKELMDSCRIKSVATNMIHSTQSMRTSALV